MPFFLLLLLALLSLQGQWPEPPDWLGPWGSLLAPLAGVTLIWLAAAWFAERQVRQLRANPDRRSTLVRQFQKHRGRHFLVLALFYLASLFFLGWGWTIKATWQERPGSEIMLLAPFLAGLALLWARFYSVDRTTHDLVASPNKPPFPTRAAYVALQARHNLLLIIPPLCLVVIQETLFFVFPQIRQHPAAQAGLAISMLAFALVSMPFLLKRFLGLVSLPPGPLRERLLAAAQKLNLRFRDVLLWPTRATIANAMVTGVFSWNRYIVVSDRLVEELTPEEIEAVFGHEAGHVKHHHLLCYIVFILASLVALAGLVQAAKEIISHAPPDAWLNTWLPQQSAWGDALEVFAALPAVAAVGLYLFIVFGYLSRRCERQADLFGCRITNTPTFISALEKVAIVNGIPRDRPGWLSSWLHGSIGERVNILWQMQNDPRLEPQFQGRVVLLKWGLPGSLVVLAVVLAFLNHHLNAEGWWEMLKWI